MSLVEIDLARTLNMMPSPAYIFASEERRFLAANSLYCELVGYTEDELKSLPWPKIMPEEYVEPAQKALSTASPGAPTIWKWRRKDGSIVAAVIMYRVMTVTHEDGIFEAYFAAVLGAGEHPIDAKTLMK